MRVLYIYAGDRKEKFKGQIGVDFPDTQFYALNHMDKFGIEAEFKEWKDLWFSKFLPFASFNLRQSLLYFASGGYDIVFGSSVINMIFFKKLLLSKKKFVLLNISLMRLWQSNKDRFLRRNVMLWLLRSLDGVVCLSKEQFDFCKREFPFLSDKIYFAPLGVDTSYHKFTEDRDPESFILSAGRDNGRDYKTVVEVARKMPGRVFEIVASPRNLKEITDIPQNVKIYFDIKKEELEEKYKKASTLLLLTHPEGVLEGADCSGQTVLLEAMAEGLPIIASKRKCLLDYVEDGKEALLVDFYDQRDVLEKLKKMTEDVLGDSLGEKARRKVEKSFKTSDMARELSLIFKKIYDSR